ncbi:MAG: DNA-binding response regulator [Deltaproteobacteria bacterium]|nr:MAG: DNA-binding response regulator [Deltaproteobacteria bacterium]
MQTRELDGISILVAEDDAGIAELLRSFFEQNGASVWVEYSGRDVMARTQEMQPDIVILDVVMPYLDGLTVLSQIRKNGIRTPAIMLTDNRTVDDKVAGLDTGADDYMTKPFSPKELLARVKALLRRRDLQTNAEELAVIRIGTITIDPLAREIRNDDGAFVPFTKTEFDLLYYLAQRKARVVEHTALLEEILGYKGDIETKALVMHIANMRRKMAKMSLDTVKIETVAGVGYKLLEC